MFRFKGMVVLLMIFSSVCTLAKSLEFESKCGNYKYIITADNAENYYESTIKHYYQEGNDEKKLFHQSEDGMHVSASCMKDKNNLDVFIFRENCGGSGCLENIYGLFDLKQKKMLLKPSDWPKGNSKEVMEILGVEPELNSEDVFCCILRLTKHKTTN